jgi:hypothetical protein
MIRMYILLTATPRGRFRSMTKVSPVKEVKSRELPRIRFFIMVPVNAMSKGNAKCLQKAPRHGWGLFEEIAWGMGGVNLGWKTIIHHHPLNKGRWLPFSGKIFGSASGFFH